jgi:hypothetical protein
MVIKVVSIAKKLAFCISNKMLSSSTDDVVIDPRRSLDFPSVFGRGDGTLAPGWFNMSNAGRRQIGVFEVEIRY